MICYFNSGYYYLSEITITTTVLITEYDLHSLKIRRCNDTGSR
jgi:hypothetical protein